MKLNKFFMGVLGTLALSACSSDDPVNTGVETPDNNYSDNYITVSIEMPTSAGGRAAWDEYYDSNKYADGTTAESTVSNIVFFFFDEYDNCIDVQKITNGDFKSPGADAPTNPYITKIGTAEVRLKSGLSYKKVAVALNSSKTQSNLSASITNVGDLLALNRDYVADITGAITTDGVSTTKKVGGTLLETEDNFGKNQMMSNSVYFETGSINGVPTDANKIVLVNITEKNIYTSAERSNLGKGGEDDPEYVDIYVERAAARVNVTPLTFNWNNYYVRKNNTNEEVKTITLYDHANKAERQIYVRPVIKGMSLNVLSKSAYLIKPIEANVFGGTYGNNGNNYRSFYWNDPLNKRSYWATTDEIAENQKMEYLTYFSWNDAEAQGTKGFVQYVNPNTQDSRPTYVNERYVNDENSQNTKVMVIAELYECDKDGNVATDAAALDFVCYGADYMLSGALLAHAANLINETVYNNDWTGFKVNGVELTAEELKNVEGIVKNAFTGVVNNGVTMGLSAGMFDLTIAESTDDNKFGEHDWLASIITKDTYGYTIPDVTTEDGEFKITETIRDAVKVEIDKVIAAKLTEINEPNILYWKGGKTYYYYTIRHQGFYNLVGNSTAEGAQDFLFGVVRNHIYDVNLNSVFGLGTPVIDPNKPINPDRPNVLPSYMSARINILKWRVVTNNATIH